MPFHQYLPDAPLDACVAKIWDWDMPASAHQFERVLPQPAAQLIINLYEDETRVYVDDASRRCIRSSGSVLGGPMLRSEIIDTAEQRRVMGVVFRPGGAHRLTGVDADMLIGQDIDLADLFGQAAVLLREQLLASSDAPQRMRVLSAWLHARMRPTICHSSVAQAIAVLDRAPQVLRIPMLARDAGISERRLAMLFRRHIGMSPKHYARLLRFRIVVDQAHLAEHVNWSQLAADGGFCDQAHFTHEFRRFAGITPSAFMAARGQHVNHLRLD